MVDTRIRGRTTGRTTNRPQGATTVRRYVYDGANLIAELDGDNHLLTQYLHGPGIDQPLAMIRNGRSYSYLTDALGSILTIVDDTDAAVQIRTVVQRYRYDAWGNILEVQDANFKQPFAYTGREWDEESGLYYYRARYYDPAVGRFLQSDPIGLAGGINKYWYVGGKPTERTDPQGLSWSPWCIIEPGEVDCYDPERPPVPRPPWFPPDAPNGLPCAVRCNLIASVGCLACSLLPGLTEKAICWATCRAGSYLLCQDCCDSG